MILLQRLLLLSSNFFRNYRDLSGIQMAPRGKRKKAGLMREDAARERMKVLGFQERVINESIKEVLKVYGEDQWFFMEDESYATLLSICLEKQEEQNKQLAEVQANQLPENQNEEMAEDQNKEIAEEEQPKQLAGEEQPSQLVEEQEEEKEQEQDMHVEYGRDQADELSITSEAVMDPSPATFHLGDASADYAPNPVGGVENLHCGWLSEEEKDPKEDSDGDDDEIIQLTPEPLCEELEELFKEVRGQKRMKKETRWDT